MEMKSVELPSSKESIRHEQSVTNVVERESEGIDIPEIGEILDIPEMPRKVEEVEAVALPPSSESVELQGPMKEYSVADSGDGAGNLSGVKMTQSPKSKEILKSVSILLSKIFLVICIVNSSVMYIGFALQWLTIQIKNINCAAYKY